MVNSLYAYRSVYIHDTHTDRYAYREFTIKIFKADSTIGKPIVYLLTYYTIGIRIRANDLPIVVSVNRSHIGRPYVCVLCARACVCVCVCVYTESIPIGMHIENLP